MRDRVEQYQVQNAVKENLIQMLQDVFREQEEKIETLENHTQAREEFAHTLTRPSLPVSLNLLRPYRWPTMKQTGSIKCG